MAVLNWHHYGRRVPPGAVSIMRGTPWGNPFVLGRDGSRAEVVQQYRVLLWAKIQHIPGYADRVRALHGRDLCCCCDPLACHGHVLESAAAYLAGLPQPSESLL